MNPVDTQVTSGPIVSVPDNGDDDCGAVGGMRIGKGTEVLGGNLLQDHTVHHKSPIP